MSSRGEAEATQIPPRVAIDRNGSENLEPIKNPSQAGLGKGV
jgi:hypothetical protein